MDAFSAAELYESTDEIAQRELVLKKVKAVLDEYSLHEGLSFMSEADAASKHLQLRTFGSYRLGVHSPEADIDTYVCVRRRADVVGQLSSALTRHLPFTHKSVHCAKALQSPQLLPESADSARSHCECDRAPRHQRRVRSSLSCVCSIMCTKLSPHCSSAVTSYVPVLKMKVDGIAVDLLFVSLSIESVPSTLDVLDDELLRGLDEPSVRSLNGVRVTERILQLVPNAAHFRTALIAIKHWARVRR